MNEDELYVIASDIHDICNDEGESAASAVAEVFGILKKLVKGEWNRSNEE